MHLATAWQMQQMDKKTIRDFGIPGLVLMENAGRGAVRLMLSHFGDLRNSKVGIVCGKGNNGGDGYVIGRYLAARDVPVTVYLLCDITDVAGDAKEHLQLLTRIDRKSTRLNSSHNSESRMPSSA
jgi:NAD(P)H-hydrate epimerase